MLRICMRACGRRAGTERQETWLAVSFQLFLAHGAEFLGLFCWAVLLLVSELHAHELQVMVLRVVCSEKGFFFRAAGNNPRPLER